MSEAAPPLRIGVFGGAFDPPHLGHVALAQAAVEQLGLDQLYIVPTGHAWHKARTLTAPVHRLRMTALAFGGLPRTRIDRLELDRAGPSYTVDTLEALRQRHPDARLFLIIGADQLEKLPTWHRWRALFDLAELVVARRGSAPLPALSADVAGTALPIRVLQLPELPYSSTDVRQRLAAGVPAHDLVPPAVAGYIERHHLYRNP